MDEQRRFKVQGVDENGDIVIMLTNDEDRAKSFFADMKKDLNEVELKDISH